MTRRAVLGSFNRQSHLGISQHRAISAIRSRWRMWRVVVACGWLSSWLMASAVAGPPFPWRSRPQGPLPYPQSQSRPQPPRTRSVAPDTSEPLDQSLGSPGLAPTEPTPAPFPTRSNRTYYTARRPQALFPAGHGIHVALSQKFLDELIRVESQVAGPVRDCILGAQVVGSQQTETSVHVRFVPSDSQAQLEFQLTGMTRNSTESRTPEAVIQSEGNHRFEVGKSVQFDGQVFLTRSPSAMLFPCQNNRAARTPASAIPILGPLVSEYALSVANQRRPESERITAERITQQVVPEFDSAVDKRLAELNQQLTVDLPLLLFQMGVSTPTTRMRTTEQLLTASLAWGQARTCPEYVPRMREENAAELRVAIHAEAVNAWLSSLPLGGQEILIQDMDRWQKELERAFSSYSKERSIRRPVSLSRRIGRTPARTVQSEESVPGLGEPTILGPLLVPRQEQADKVPVMAEPELEPEPILAPAGHEADESPGIQSQMILAAQNPISVEFGQGEAVVTLVAAFRIAPAPQTDFHRIRIPITSTFGPEGLRVTPGTVRVEAASSGGGGMLAEFTRAAIEKQVQQRLQPTNWPVERPLKRDAGEPVTLRLNELASDAGWMTLVWGVESSQSGMTGERKGVQ